jgi:hypothetical protein
MGTFEIFTFLGIFLFLAMSYFYSGNITRKNSYHEETMDKEYFENMDSAIEYQYANNGMLREP